MSEYYDTGYEYGGYPVYVGTGFDEAPYTGLPPLSYVHQYSAITERGRIEISTRDIIGHALVYQMMNWGMTYAMRKGFLDAGLMGYVHAGRIYGSFQMAMRRVITVGSTQIIRSVTPGVLASAALVGAGRFFQDLYYGIAGMHIGDLRFVR